jgi:hypothetical protein
MFCIWRNGEYECDAKDYGFPCVPDDTCGLDDDECFDDLPDEIDCNGLEDYDPE